MALANDRIDLLETAEGADGDDDATSTFWDEMVEHIEHRRAETADPAEASFFNRPLSEHELVEWLQFQAYYELRACQFIGGWLATTPTLAGWLRKYATTSSAFWRFQPPRLACGPKRVRTRLACQP